MPVLKQNGVIAETEHQKANVLADQFHSVSSTSNYSQDFLCNRDNLRSALIHQLRGHSAAVLCKDQRINRPKSKTEFIKSNLSSKITSPGGDRLCYEMFKHLPDSSIDIFLQLFNAIWTSGYIPKNWLHSIVIPIHKANKPANLSVSYRPISLTSNLCKLMEKIVATRLKWFLEKNNLLNNLQSGFRSRRRTTDHLLRLHDAIYKALANKRSVLTVFLDIEKAYDMVCRDALLLKLLRLGISGEMFNFIKSFLTNRTFQVRIDSSYSHTKKLENGLPQGSILSPILFSIMINDLPNVLTCPAALFADDCCFWEVGTNINQLNNTVQKNLNRVNEWCSKWGFKVSKSKSAAVLFTRMRGVPNTSFNLDNTIIPIKSEFKYLGIVFQANGTYTQHTNYVVDKCKKRLNLLKAVKGSSWGAAKAPMLTLYRSLIRSVTDYGMQIFYNSNNKNNHKIEKIQNEAFRLCTGALKSTPICSLQHACNELPPRVRYLQLSLLYRAHLQSFYAHPTLSVIQDSWFDWFPDFPNYCSFNLLTKDFFADNFAIHKLSPPCNPLWSVAPCNMDLSLCGENKFNEEAVRQNFLKLIYTNYNDYLHLYTDGSKSEFGTSSALYVHRFQVKRVIKTNDNASVFTAELYAILTALYWISQNRYAKNLIISDSLSSLKAISCHENDCRHFLVDKIKLLHYFLDSIDVNGTYLWVPSHNGIQGNEIADNLAKTATRKNCHPGIPTVNLDLSLSEIISIIIRHCLMIWQQQYISNSTGAFYKKCFPSIYNRNLSSCPQIFRLQTGHCRLNSHMQRIGLHDTGLCSRCNVPEDVIHYLFVCPKYNH